MDPQTLWGSGDYAADDGTLRFPGEYLLSVV
jgi:hypothetical protein